jgi:hypothetical protein
LSTEEAEEGWELWAMVFMQIFNNVIGPFVAFAIISTDCFHNAFTSTTSSLAFPASTVSSSYSYVAACHGYFNTNDSLLFTCFSSANAYEYTSATVTYSPPFTFSFQCR